MYSRLPAPPTSQDTVDHLAAEFATAALLRTHATKRYDKVKTIVEDEFPDQVSKVRNEAAQHMEKRGTDILGNDWLFNFSANKPALRCDVEDLRTELVKRGVKASLIDEAINKVSKKSTPALLIVAKPSV